MASLETDLATFFGRNPYYQQRDIAVRIATDITTVVQSFRFAHKIAMWGETSQCKLCIYGPLPFPYNNGVSVVPVQVWLTPNFPVDPPTIYIVPSSDNHKVVVGHRAVDNTGLCYCPALAKWAPDSSTIRPVLLQLLKIFSNFPPMWEDKESAEATTTANALGSAAAVLLGVGNGDGDADEARLCVVCISEQKDTVLVPCGHCCICSTCAASLSTCPMCRSKIQLRQRVFV
jgi:hypothetical protein